MAARTYHTGGEATRWEPDEDASRILAELGTALLPRVDELTRELMDEILRTDPAYRDAVPVADLTESCTRNVTQLLRKLTLPHIPALEYLTFLTELGRRRVAQGLPLESLLHAFRIGARTVWSALVAEARNDQAKLDALADGATRLWDLHDSSSSRVTAAYRAAELDTIGRTREWRFELVDALFEGRGNDPAFAWKATSALKLSREGRVTVVLAETDGDPAARGPFEVLLADHGLASAWRPLGDRTVGIVEVDRVPLGDLARILRAVATGRVGIGPRVEGLSGLPQARHLAEIALATVPPGQRDVAVLEERLPAALLAAVPDVAALLVQDCLGGVLALQERERSLLLEVIEGYISAGGSVTDTAEALYCHRNTVLKRLRRVRAVTSRDLSDPEDLLAFALAVKALRAGAAPGTPRDRTEQPSNRSDESRG